MSGGSSIYSPLPQSNSDSDEFSEEELHSSNERLKVISRISKLQKQGRSEIILNGKKPRVINYKQLDDDRDLGITLNGFQIGNDDIAVLKPNNKIEKFTTLRKVCFTFSIFLCVFTTVFFLWILPCEIGSCPSTIYNTPKKLLYDIELFGPISIVPNARYTSDNLVFLFRNSFNGEVDKTRNPSEGNGVISLLGGSKEVSWWVSLEREPKDIDCNVIDVDLDGLNDCLVSGKNNLLKAIESLSGKELWDVYGGEVLDSRRCNFDFPIVLPDLDGDNVRDLLSICSVGAKSKEVVSGSRNYFVLISGRTGIVIGKPTEITQCYSLFNIMLEKEYVISYTCLNSTSKESVKTFSLRELLSNVNVSISHKLRLNQTDSHRLQHKNNVENLFYVDGRCFSLENKGRCPDKCSMIVTIKDERNGKKNQTLWVMRNRNSYGMTPIVMKFDKFSGFVFKYWKWESDEKVNEEFSGTTNSNKDEVKESNLKIRSLSNVKFLESAMFQDDMPQSKRTLNRIKRMLNRRFSNGLKHVEGTTFKKENFTFHRITERVVLITFNETDIYPINTSLSEIIQICRNVSNCQPDAYLQRQSLLITDIDHDNFEDLISYSSSFINRLDQESSLRDGIWQLQSIVQVIHLESELPKLYKNKN